MSRNRNYEVLLVDDHSMTRLGWKTLAQTSEVLNIQWLESATLGTAVEIYKNEDHVDLVMLDLKLPDSHGLLSVQRFLRACPQARLAVFTATTDEAVIRQALALGACAYLTKNAEPERTLTQLEKLLFEPPNATAHACRAGGTMAIESGPRQVRTSGSYFDRLNSTQLEVLELLLEGLNNVEIANERKLAIGTVKNCVSTIMMNFDVDSRNHLISLFS